MGRFTLKITAFAMIILAGWWWIATASLQKSLTEWFEVRRSEGWQAEVSDISRGGFPMRITSMLTDTSLADPETTTSLHVPQITLSTPIYWPGHLTVTLPDAPIVLSAPNGRLSVLSDGTNAALRLHPGTSLQLEALSTQSDNLILDLIEGRLLSIQTMQAEIQQTTTPETYDINVLGAGFAPGSIIRQSLHLPTAWPEAFETLAADMTVTFDRPWDRSALDNKRPQPRAIMVEKIAAQWADLSITIEADLQIDPNGIASGTAKFQARNWHRMLDLAGASGALQPQARLQAENFLGLLSGLSGNTETLNVEIAIDKGRMRMGFIPLGNAPRFILN